MFPINEIYHLEDELIVVAIDAYMHKCHFQKVGNEYIQTGPSNSTAAGPGAMRSIVVSAPGENGNGGGTCVRVSDHSTTPESITNTYKPTFDTIRSRVRTALKPFHNIPEPDEINSACEGLQGIVVRLNVGAEGEDGRDPSGMRPALHSARAAAQNLFNGLAFDNLRKQVPETINTILAYRALTGCLLAALTAEKQVMEDSHEAVKNSIQSAIEGCKALMAKSEAGNLVVTLKIISNVLSVVQTVLGAQGATNLVRGVTLAGSITEASLFVLSDKVIEGSIKSFFENPFASVDAVISELESAVEQINSDAYELEEANRLALSDTIAAVTSQSSRGRFALDLEPLISSDLDGDLVIQNVPQARDVANSHLPDIANALRGIEKDLMALNLTDPLYRTGEFSMSPKGPASDVFEMQLLIRDLLRDLSTEVDDYALNLLATINAFVANEGEHVNLISRYNIDASTVRAEMDSSANDKIARDRNPWFRYDL